MIAQAPGDTERSGVSISRMGPEDLPAAQALLAQLGYALDRDELQRRYTWVAEADGHRVWLGEYRGQVVALCHFFVRPALDKPPEVVVQALVVDDAARGHGIGKTMMDAVEAWASRQGFTSVALASHVARSAAHSFYERIGYIRSATSHQFRKLIG